jgi:hypothetical protein
MRKRCLIGCGVAGILGIAVCAGLGGLFVGAVMALTRPVTDASEQFLALVGHGKFAEAYASTSEGFRAQQDEASFAGAVRQLGLADYASVTWHTRRIQNEVGTAEGTVVTKTGGSRPIAIRLLQEDGKWRIAGVSYAGVDLAEIRVLPHALPEAG